MREEGKDKERRSERMAERMTNDLFELVHTVTLHGYSGSTLAQVTSSAERRLHPDQTDMHRFLFTLTCRLFKVSAARCKEVLVMEDNMGHTPGHQTSCPLVLSATALSSGTMHD